MLLSYESLDPALYIGVIDFSGLSVTLACFAFIVALFMYTIDYRCYNCKCKLKVLIVYI